MAKKGAKITPSFVPVPGEIRQGLLFADARTPAQAAVLAAADGTRNLATIARQCNLSREECERIIAELMNDGELRPATDTELREGADRLRAAGRLEGAVQLLLHLVENSGGEEAQERLAELLVLSARRKEAAGVYSALAQRYAKAGRFGEALTAARRAAALLPGNWQLQNALSELAILTGRPDEAARVWRAYARRLANVGNFEQALGIIDTAQKQLAGNDILMYAEAEILSLLERARQDQGTGGAAEVLSEQARAFLHPAVGFDDVTASALAAPAIPVAHPNGMPDDVIADAGTDHAGMAQPTADPTAVFAATGSSAIASHADDKAFSASSGVPVVPTADDVQTPSGVRVPPPAPDERSAENPPVTVEPANASVSASIGDAIAEAGTPSAETDQAEPFSSATAERMPAPCITEDAGSAFSDREDAEHMEGGTVERMVFDPARPEEAVAQPPRPLHGYLYSEEDESGAGYPGGGSGGPAVNFRIGTDSAAYRGQPVRRRGWRLGTAAYLLGGIVVLSIVATGYDIQTREGMKRAIEQSAWRISSCAQEPLHLKQNAAILAEKELLQGAPCWDFMQSPEYAEQRKRVQLFSETVARELQQLRARQEAVIAEWRREPAEKKAEKNITALRELAEDKDVTSQPVMQARELYREWLQKQSQRPDALNVLLATLHDLARPAAERYDAYNTLVMEHPYAFLRDYDPARTDAPQGCRNLSVPVEINAYCGRNRESLPLRLLVNDREVKPPYELPLDPQEELSLYLPGFRPALANPAGAPAVQAEVGRLPVPRPFTRQQIYILSKVARWRNELTFAPSCAVFSGDGRRIVAAGAGAYAIVNSEDGRVVAQGKLPGGADAAVSLAVAGDWVFCQSGGRVAAFATADGAQGRALSQDGVSLNNLTAAVLGGAEGDTVALVSVGPDLAGESFWGGRAVQALRVPDLRPVWGDAGSGTPESAASGPALFAEGRLLYVDEAGRLQIRPVAGVSTFPQPGEAAGTLPLPGVSGSALTGRPGLFALPVAGGQDRVLLLVPQAGRVTALLLSGGQQVSTLWRAEGEYGRWMQERDGTVWLLRGGREIEARTLADGKVTGRFARPDGLSCDPVFLPGRLIVGGSDGAGKGLLQVLRESGGSLGGTLWEYALPSPPAAFGVWREGRETRIVCVSGRELFFLDD